MRRKELINDFWDAVESISDVFSAELRSAGGQPIMSMGDVGSQNLAKLLAGKVRVFVNQVGLLVANRKGFSNAGFDSAESFLEVSSGAEWVFQFLPDIDNPSPLFSLTFETKNDNMKFVYFSWSHNGIQIERYPFKGNGSNLNLASAKILASNILEGI